MESLEASSRWSSIECQCSGSPRRCEQLVEAAVQHVLRVAAEHGIPIPNRDRVEVLAIKAAEAESAFFEAALHEPTTEELEQFFSDFLLRAVAGPDSTM